MKTIKLNIVNETFYYEKLDNGLEIYIYYDKDTKNSGACYLTKFGGLDTEFIPIGEKEMIKVPTGIAHFLEHKLFEQESGDSVHEYYKKSGTYNNAMTDYKTTNYIINGPINFKENLEFLLKYVNSPYFTDKNVEKEKGIILEEESMGKDNPNRLFFETVNRNLFNSIPYDKKIIGTIEDIKSITKEELYTCYNTFYNPSNMVLFVVSNLKPEDVIDIAKKNTKNIKEVKIIKKEYDEKEEVRKEKEVIHSDKVNETRMSYSLKYKTSRFNATKAELDVYLRIFLFITVGELSNFNIELKNKKIIKDDIFTYVDFEESANGDYVIININALTNKTNEFIKLLEDRLNKKEYNEEDFNLYRKDLLAHMLWGVNSRSNIMNSMVRMYLFNKKIDNEIIDMRSNLNFKKFEEIVDKLTFNNKSIVIIKK